MGTSVGIIKEEEKRKALMWLYPKLVGSSPSERWGHSACFSQPLLYVFGGCCGGMHFSDVSTLNLDTMTWSTLVTLGKSPGPRDSHTSTLWGNKMIVFGGTNGSHKVNDVHILDLGLNEWVQPACRGPPPPPRESHTATLVGGDKLVVFGGSGEGVGNYLNDLHVLDLNTMSWTSPEVKGDPPPPRDSHVSISVGSKVYVYGGDCGDRYLGDVDVFDVNALTWSRLEVRGLSPGRRAGHAAVRIGTKVCIIGGVGDKKYYNDAWILDTSTTSWARLDVCGQQPQGRFSHTAIVTDYDIAIYGGCGEDERPLGELLILQLGGEHPYGRYNLSLCKNFGKHQENKRKGPYGTQNGLNKVLVGRNCIIKAETTETHELDTWHSKKKRTSNANSWERDPEQEEHSLTLSQNSSSPSQSDQEQTTTVPNPATTVQVSQEFQFPPLNQPNKSPTFTYTQSNKWIPQKNLPDVYFLGETRPNNQKHGHFVTSHSTIQNLMGSEVQGKVDGAFDSGYLMTATVNGRIFRGVLFAPNNQGSSMMQRASNPSQSSSAQIQIPLGHHPCNSHGQPAYGAGLGLGLGPSLAHQPVRYLEKAGCPARGHRGGPSRDGNLRERSDLQGLVLTLGGPASSGIGH